MSQRILLSLREHAVDMDARRMQDLLVTRHLTSPRDAVTAVRNFEKRSEPMDHDFAVKENSDILKIGPNDDLELNVSVRVEESVRVDRIGGHNRRHSLFPQRK